MERFSRSFIARWSDCDANGHLRNTCYSEYAVEVRMAFLAAHSYGLKEFRQHGIGPVILREEIDYLRECHMGEELEVDYTALGLSPHGTRFLLAHDVLKPDGSQAAHLVIKGGWLDLTARRLAPPPQPLKEILEQVERAEASRCCRTRGPGRSAPRAALTEKRHRRGARTETQLPRQLVPSLLPRARTHLSLAKDAPDSRSVEPAQLGRVVALPRVGGLHHRYTRCAA